MPKLKRSSWIFNPYYETMEWEEKRNLQLERLKITVRHAYENSPFYRRFYKDAGVTPDDIKTLDDIKKLPFLTKDHLRELYPYGFLAVPLEEIVEVHMSSGTTGTPTIALYTQKDIEIWAESMARCLAMSGLTKRDILQVTPSFGLFVGGFGFYYGARKIGAMMVPSGPGFTERQIRIMKDLGVTMLGGIFSYALRLAEVAWKMGIDPARDLKVRKGLFGAEFASESLRERIAEVWDMDVHDVYGFTEAGGNGTSCDCYLHDGLHIWDDLFIYEIIDPKTGEPVEPEEGGEVVVTSLLKEAMPIIRYRVRDIAYMYDRLSCDCGRTGHLHSVIRGRTDDMVKVKGVNIWPSQVEYFLLKFKELSGEFQLVVDKVGALDRLTIKVETVKRLSEEEKRKLAEELSLKLGEELFVTPDVEILDPGTFVRDIGKPKRVLDLRPK